MNSFFTSNSGVANKPPVITLLSFSGAGEGLARVLMDVTHTQSSRDDHNRVMAAISSEFGNKLSPVPGSFRTVVPSTSKETVSGLVRVNTEAVAFDDNTKGFRAISANIYADDEENLWELKKTSTGRVLIRDSGICDEASLAAILDSHVTKNALSYSGAAMRATASAEQDFGAGVQGGDYITFGAAVGSKEGFVLASVSGTKNLLVLPFGEEDVQEINRNAVIQSHSTADFPDTDLTEQEQMDIAVSTSRGVVNVESLIAYYKKVYGAHPKFFAELSKRIRGHVFA